MYVSSWNDSTVHWASRILLPSATLVVYHPCSIAQNMPGPQHRRGPHACVRTKHQGCGQIPCTSRVGTIPRYTGRVVYCCLALLWWFIIRAALLRICPDHNIVAVHMPVCGLNTRGVVKYHVRLELERFHGTLGESYIAA